MELIGKHNIEINYVADGRIFLNYWDWAHGNDVVCEVVDDKLMRGSIDENGEELPPTEITFIEYLKYIGESIKLIKLTPPIKTLGGFETIK